MTNEEMAEESLISYRKEPKWAGKMFMQDENTCYKDGFLAGLKASRPKWHDLRESPKDLPKNGEHVLANNMLTTECVTFKKEADGNHWRHDMFELCSVMKWCEIPKFDDKE